MLRLGGFFVLATAAVLTAATVALTAASAAPASEAAAAEADGSPSIPSWSTWVERRRSGSTGSGGDGRALLTQTYLGELRLRSVRGEQLACSRALIHDPYSAEHRRVEQALCDAVRQAIAATAAPFALLACSVDRFSCDQGLPLASARLRFGTDVAAGNDSASSLLSVASVHGQLSLELLTRAQLVRMDYMQVTDYNECAQGGGGGSAASAHDCSPDAVCYNKVGSYACVCKRNFVDLLSTPGGADAGRLCAPKCGTGYCTNGGRCADASLGACSCPEQYTGTRCEILKHDLVVLWTLASSLTVCTVLLLPLGVWLCCRRLRLRQRGGGGPAQASSHCRCAGGVDRKAYRALA